MELKRSSWQKEEFSRGSYSYLPLGKHHFLRAPKVDLFWPSLLTLFRNLFFSECQTLYSNMPTYKNHNLILGTFVWTKVIKMDIYQPTKVTHKLAPTCTSKRDFVGTNHFSLKLPRPKGVGPWHRDALAEPHGKRVTWKGPNCSSTVGWSYFWSMAYHMFNPYSMFFWSYFCMHCVYIYILYIFGTPPDMHLKASYIMSFKTKKREIKTQNIQNKK